MGGENSPSRLASAAASSSLARRVAGALHGHHHHSLAGSFSFPLEDKNGENSGQSLPTNKGPSKSGINLIVTGYSPPQNCTQTSMEGISLTSLWTHFTIKVPQGWTALRRAEGGAKVMDHSKLSSAVTWAPFNWNMVVGALGCRLM